jgi:hypothetical protein
MNFKHGSQYTLTVANIVLMVFLLLGIFVVMMIPPQFQKTVYQLCFGGILISAFFCIDKKHRIYMRWFVALALLLQWSYLFTAGFVLNWVSKSVTIALYIIIAIWLVKQAASSKTVTRIVILESVNGYLMIGMFYSVIIALIMLLNPQAYSFHNSLKNSTEILTNFNEYLYYGFNAFTTVTYGDVMPVSPAAKSISMAMGFTGQMYVAVIIAMLVGKYAGESRKSS